MRSLFLLSFALLLAPAPALACDGASFAAASLRATAEAASLSADDKAALQKLAKELSRTTTGCEVPPGRCLGSVESAAVDAGRAWGALQAAVASAQALDAIPAELDRIRQIHERLSNLDRLIDAGSAPPGVADDKAGAQELLRRTQEAVATRARAEAAIRAAELAWLDAMTRLNQGRCTNPCEVGPCADSKRDRADVAKLRQLYQDLAAADADFLATWDEATLRNRVSEGGAVGVREADVAARAAWLRVRLAGLAPRPSTARAELAFFLAQIAGQPDLGPVAGRKLAQWLQFERDWRAANAGVDKRIVRMIKAWRLVDQADDQRSRMIAADRVQTAMRYLDGAGVSPPHR